MGSPATPEDVPGYAGEATNGQRPEAFKIQPLERFFMLELAGSVGRSPRRLKRFVNTYRMLKAASTPLERERAF